MNTSIAPKHVISGLRQTIFGLVLASSSIFLMPNAVAQDTIYILSPSCPETLLVTDVGEESNPITVSTVSYGQLVFSHFAEMVHFMTGPDMQDKLYVRVSYENPLRTLKRGNRLERTGGCYSAIGYYVFAVAVITGP